MKAGKAFIYHLSQGTDARLIEEYELARGEEMLRPRFCGIHCTALGGQQFEEWERKAGEIDAEEDIAGEENVTIVWSPFSNLESRMSITTGPRATGRRWEPEA